MGRGRSSTNYTDDEKQRLLRLVAAVLPRRQSQWKLVASRYNASRPAHMAERDTHSLKRKFKTMTLTKGAGDPFIEHARQLVAKIRDLTIAGEQPSLNDDEDEDEDENEDHANGSAAHDEPSGESASSSSPPAIPAFQIPLPAGGRTLLPATSAASTMPLFHPYTLQLPTPPVVDVSSPPAKRARTESHSELMQFLMVLREENAQREVARRAEREESIAREERLREESRELRRQEREEMAAREERYWREMAEQRRRDREDATSRHEQMMVILAAMLKPGIGAAAST